MTRIAVFTQLNLQKLISDTEVSVDNDLGILGILKIWIISF